MTDDRTPAPATPGPCRARRGLSIRGLACGLLLAWSALAGAASHAPFHAVVTRVSDGDTVWVRPSPGQGLDGRYRKIRLLGLDAPEICQRGGREARDALARRVLKRAVFVRPRARDDYGRLLAWLVMDGEDIGAELVAQGHAWNSRWHRRRGPFDAQEQAAREAGLGVFADPHAQPPWVFRRTHGPCR